MNKLVLFYVNISIDQQSTDNDTWKPVENDVVSVFVSIFVKQVMRAEWTSLICFLKKFMGKNGRKTNES
ncbi:hypothetical protein EWB00_007524, partial [Schistosoma japonicum]